MRESIDKIRNPSVDFDQSTVRENIVSFKEPLSYEDIAARLGYDPVTGIFTWLVDVGKNVKAGSEAGTTKTTRKNAAGQPVLYRYIRLLDHTFPSARLAWLLHYGKWPEGRIAPRNGDQLDLKIDNLIESRSMPGTYDHSNPEDRKRYHRERRQVHPLDWKSRDLEKNFGIDFQTYCNMVAAQNNVCAICEQPETVSRGGQLKALAVDHCHTTGSVRALLCQTCNQMIGFSKDDPAKLRAGAAYLEKHQAAAANVVPLKTEERA